MKLSKCRFNAGPPSAILAQPKKTLSQYLMFAGRSPYSRTSCLLMLIAVVMGFILRTGWKPTLGVSSRLNLVLARPYIYPTPSRAGALMQWLKLPAYCLESRGDRGFEPHSGLQVSKKQYISSPLTRKDSILWGASVTERQRALPQTARARISNPVSGGQCHIIHLTILGRFSWSSLASMCTKVA